ncbi:hypothetical protein QTG54_003926 [Skeletonema marinoi]|uniref:DOMON domain-containing protein n=1 Tax=Skeletonema marinoi TaxID=267567 RepID=A0AAD8YIN6_9STRA|nr:hypothetical protein QTG54_003926 [Skeletonema marinoi]
MSPLYYALVLIATCFLNLDTMSPVFASASELGSQDSCSFHLNLSPSTDVTLQQHLSGANTLTIALTLEGQGWVGVGFNRNGNMIGSTVVIGFPGEPLTQDLNPGRYYLGAKEMKQINRIDTSGTRVGVEWPKGLSDVSNDDDEGGDEEWRRSLYLPQDHHRLLAISDASIEQNSTHTTLKFTRPLQPSDSYMTQVHPNDLNTLIWAVGSSNQFGYHGSQRGSHALNFTECLHGTLVSLSLNDAFEVEEQKVEEIDVPEGSAQAKILELDSQKATSSGAYGLDASLYHSFVIVMSMCYFVFGSVGVVVQS